MKRPLLSLLLSLLLVSALPAAASAAETEPPRSVLVSSGEVVYSYENDAVCNDGGTVYNTLGTVCSLSGTVYSSGGVVYAFGGAVYAKSGLIFNLGGTVYTNDAEVITPEGHEAEAGAVYGYHELKLADYYEPFVTLSGVTTEPGSEQMIISEDSVCRATPREGYRIVAAKATVGDIVREEDGSVVLRNVDADTTLKLYIRETAS